ncbi:sigma-70 family RNA polymerase sigma factor [Bacillus paranthracis]|uniref:Putative sigma-70 family RNA polymerase sigma factor n=1 Tax=uncultured Caudovirales phage TaxID=2100421 RepID=A0A2H4J8J4_9CAUD|nr:MULTISPECIES: sigma-70 family RNA polymerase sigma factor [Bacillus cereus group]ASN69637.1 putative sigma-70 family RNA polymerase sigma factor [uncultured Caudovirales phage]ONG71171.1 RNA polymerase subunit sigma-24 [Bacillus cereus]MCU5387382.1 sigma-70 family RNA polymerase sigma factor [Bacillus paranthracis]MDA1824611.1 sigma-70 family RNA polymerase sigma factor [Bacillus cereus group sp. BY25LC]MDA2192028.1 sigma-70 family RNA polymerase sigma factor [Bacillus cereus group sp. Bc23
MIDLIKQYKETLNQLLTAKEKATKQEEKIINRMISDIEYSLNWMRNGREPEPKRGIERRASYQRDVKVNPLLIQRYLRSKETEYEWDKEQKENAITTWEKIQLDDALSTLSKIEKEIFVMYKVGMFTQEEIAEMRGVTRSTIQQHLRRADKKIAQQVGESLFFVN